MAVTGNTKAVGDNKAAIPYVIPIGDVESASLQAAVTKTGAGATITPASPKRTFQALGTTSAGVGAATIVIQASNVAVPSTDAASADWLTLGTITLTLGTTQVTDGFASDAPWLHVRSRVTDISGTDATVTVLMGT